MSTFVWLSFLLFIHFFVWNVSLLHFFLIFCICFIITTFIIISGAGAGGAATKNRQEGEGKDDEEKAKMRGEVMYYYVR